MTDALLELRMPRVSPLMTVGTVKVFVAPGTRVEAGTPLFEFRIDLTAAADQNCRPISTYRVVASEPATVRAASVRTGDEVRAGDVVATLDAERTLVRTRPLRVEVGGCH